MMILLKKLCIAAAFIAMTVLNPTFQFAQTGNTDLSEAETTRLEENPVIGVHNEQQDDKNSRIDDYPAGFDKICGARILLTEDNEINQQVAKEILEAEGFFVDIANNGQESFEMIREKDYDIVLMDLQMPVLDGYRATEKIRGLNGYENLPVVAMTADAMAGVREEVLSVGMNDYITKPIDPNELWKALTAWIPPGERELPDNFIPASRSDDYLQLPEIPGIDVQGGIKRVGGNLKLYTKLLRQFAEDFADIEKNIRVLIEADDLDAAVREAHTIKGVSGNIGSKELQELSAELEASLKEQVISEDKITALGRKTAGLIELITGSNLIAEQPQADTEQELISEEKLRQDIAEALESLKKRKPKPALTILESLESVQLSDDLGGKIEETIQFLSKYKMKDAAVVLESLLAAETIL